MWIECRRTETVQFSRAGESINLLPFYYLRSGESDREWLMNLRGKCVGRSLTVTSTYSAPSGNIRKKMKEKWNKLTLFPSGFFSGLPIGQNQHKARR